MAKKNFQTKSHWPQMTILIPLFMMPLLLHLSFGFDTSSITCAPFGSDPWCPEGFCCNRDGYCGTTTGFCGEGNCSTQCPASYGQCGLQNDNVGCPNLWSCCNSYGWCGTGSAFCGLHNCTSQCPIGICGKNGGRCPDGSCCNIYGYCGTNDGYCGATCVSQCPTIPPSLGPGPAGPWPGPWPWQGPGGPHRDRPYRGPHRKSGGANQLGIGVGISVLAVAILIGCVAIALFMRKRFGDTGFEEEEVPIALEGMPERFSYKQLSVATKGFSEESKLGQGGFGSVYRGVLPSYGIEVAVKRINSDSSQGEKEFMAEVSIISRLRHRNLIQLQGWCKDVARQKYLLVYELMPHGSLDKVLFRRAGSQMACLSWLRRFNIVKGTAAALDYLHQGWKQQVIHRDIKASNIMLDEEWNAKLGDFGLARLVDHERAGATTMVAGTYGYIAPEAATSGRFTDKTDVFAFGAVVLEIVCGRKAFLAEAPPDEMVLVDWVWERLSEGALLSTVEKRLDDYDEYWMEVVLIIGLLCSHPDPAARPSMRLVVEVLGGDVQVPSIPTSKPATVYSSNSETFSIYGPKSGSNYNSRSQDPLLLVRSTSISDYTA